MSTKFEDFAIANHKKHQSLAPSVESNIKNVLSRNSIEYFSVTHRVKTIDSILEKIERKKYKDPKKHLTDISGIRIITFFENDIENVLKIIKECFDISEENSSNKTDSLSTDKIGYRSHHFVAKLGKNRSSSPEYADISDLYFEIQVRTVLQHAWAVISHDRPYKFDQKLPTNIQRKLNLFAGLLEIADNGFVEVLKDIEEYTKSVSEKIQSNQNLEINTITLTNFIDKWAKENSIHLQEINEKSHAHIEDLIHELAYFGINSIDSLTKFIPKNFATVAYKNDYSTNIFGLLRDWLVINDFDKIKNYPARLWVFDQKEVESSLEIYKNYLTQETIQEIFSDAIYFDQE